MAKQKPETKLCKHCKTEIPYSAKVCPNCRKRVKGGKLKWIIIIIVLLVIFAVATSGGSTNDGPTKVGTVGDEDSTAGSNGDDTNTTEEVQTEYYVGDILMDGDTKIVYMASGIYEDEYSEPDEGYQYIYLEFAFENTSDDTDTSISFYSFDAYADGYSADMYYGGDEDLSATLSAGRSTTGYIYFTVPEDAEEIEIEYTTNYFTEDKITFIYEGEKDSGYVLEENTAATDGAYSAGDVIEAGDLTITYVSCEADESDNMFIQPKDGYHYITLTFEFENTGDDDEYVSYYDFDCYADGIACEQSYFRDDGLSATISSGHKANGTVTFEVPDDATTVEAEFLTNYWTSSRIVFTCTE
ncbi:MAG: DUF4352 domain-containing protein [Clostridiales bacterium]|nr:DUF4352 domain-containing protein [Clostridiales bacterium]